MGTDTQNPNNWKRFCATTYFLTLVLYHLYKYGVKKYKLLPFRNETQSLLSNFKFNL